MGKVRFPTPRQLVVAVLALVVAVPAGCGGAGTGHPEAHLQATGRGEPPAHRPAAPRIDLNADPAAIRRRATVPILTYHQIRPWRASDTAIDRAYIMPPRVFRAQLAHLAARGWHAISPDALLAHLTTGAPLPRRPVMLTFDDADEQQFTIGLPELRRHHFTATFFIMTVVLGRPGYMTVRQLRALQAAGMTLGAHTWDHHRVDEYAGRDWAIQIAEPTRRLRHIAHRPIRYFAYPFGAWSTAAFPHLVSAGFHAAFQLEDKPMDPSAPLLTLRRMIADPTWSLRDLDRRLARGA
jgi:peptidoglycan/xylan/chitin deacetylase (PgdA/CDA1 family)